MDVKRNRARAALAYLERRQEQLARHYILLSGASASIVVVAIVAFLIAGSRRTSAAPPLPAGTVEVPKFVVDPSWPHIPNGWTLGQVSSAASDADGNIWIIHRVHSVRPGVKTGPPVMEFDAAGNYMKGWGGQSRGEAYTWPSTEHPELPSITKEMSGSAAMGTTIRS